MEKIKRKPLFHGIRKAILFAALPMLFFPHGNGLALQAPAPLRENTSRAYFADSSQSGQEDSRDGFASSRTTAVPVDETVNDSPVISTPNDATPAYVEELRTAPVGLDELPDWQLVHSDELPFGEYFIDTRVVGSVRYHADYSLEMEYDILRELSNIQKDLKQYLAIPAPKETIEVFFFRSDDAYRKFLAYEFPEAPFDRRALYIKKPGGPGMVMIVGGPDMKEDLRHEMTHAFLHATMPYIPLWLDEGLAEYFEKPRESRASDNPYFKNVARKTMFGQVPSVGRLEKMNYFEQMGANEYCDAWSWVHFMLHHSRQTHVMLAGYLQLLAKSGEKTPPLSTYLTKSVPDSKKAYLEHFRSWKSRNNVDAPPKSRQASHDYDRKDENGPEKEKSGSQLTRGWTESLFR